MSECMTDIMGGGWKLVEEWSITGGSSYTGTNYTGGLSDAAIAAAYDKVRITVSGTVTYYNGSYVANKADISIYACDGSNFYASEKTLASFESKTIPVNLATEFFVLSRAGSAVIVPDNHPDNHANQIDAVMLKHNDTGASSSALTVKIYVK